MSYQDQVYHEQGATKLVIATGGVLENNGSIQNKGILTSTGTITNSGTINNTGTISGSGDIKTGGSLEVSSGGVFSDVSGKWDDMRVPLATVRVGSVGPPGYSIFLTGTGSTKGVRAYMFDPGSEEQVFFDVQMSHRWKQGSNLKPHMHWSPMTTAAGVVRWGLEYTVSAINGTFAAPVIIYSTDASTGAQQYDHLLASFAEIDMSTYTSNPSVMLKCRLFRDAASTKDTYAGDAAGHEFDFHFQVDRLGTVTFAGT